MPDEPWVPDEPAAAWPPDAIPVVVSDWQQAPGGARAHPLARTSHAVLEKRDHGQNRARRFAEAWRSLRQANAARLRDPEYLEWLCTAGVVRRGLRAQRGGALSASGRHGRRRDAGRGGR